MNRKKIKWLILNGITIVCVTNTFGLMNTSYEFADNKRSEVIREELLLKGNQLFNEDFNEVMKEQDNIYKTW